MMRPLLQRLTSRKWLAFVGAVVIGCIAVYVPDFPKEALDLIKGLALGYIGVEGAVDLIAIVTRWLAERRAKTVGKENQLPQGH